MEGTALLFVNFGDIEADYCHVLLGKLRDAGIKSELYPNAAKMKKQMKYADDKRIPFVALAGENELKNNTVTLKNMGTGAQDEVNIDELAARIMKL